MPAVKYALFPNVYVQKNAEQKTVQQIYEVIMIYVMTIIVNNVTPFWRVFDESLIKTSVIICGVCRNSLTELRLRHHNVWGKKLRKGFDAVNSVSAFLMLRIPWTASNDWSMLSTMNQHGEAFWAGSRLACDRESKCPVRDQLLIEIDSRRASSPWALVRPPIKNLQIFVWRFWVNDGTRTHDPQNHNLMF